MRITAVLFLLHWTPAAATVAHLGHLQRYHTRRYGCVWCVLCGSGELGRTVWE